MKFLFGDILECLLLFLAEEAGHTVTQKQAEVNVNGVLGHIDAVIDGVVVDVKSASTYSFKKFKDGSLETNDPFGYYEQLAGYSKGLDDIPGAFLAIDKTLGHITLLSVSTEQLVPLDINGRVQHLKEMLGSDQLPGRCYEDEAMGEGGNRKLGVNCSYCPFKQECWKDSNGGLGLRSFIYSTGPVYLTTVVKEPKTVEVFLERR